MTDLTPETTFLIDFNVQWVPAALGLNIPSEAAAAMLDITAAQFTAYVAEVEAEVNRTVDSLLAQPEVIQAVDRFAVPQGGTVMTIGDSITTYRYGYAALLQAMLRLRRSNDQFRFVNVAQSGYTSTHGLENTYSQFLAQQPDWVCIKFGVNDCKQFGGPQAKTLVSLDEYRANMTAMVAAFLHHTPARPVLLTPTPVVEKIVNENPDFRAVQMTWSNEAIQACAEVIRTLAGQYDLPLVDLVDAFSTHPDPTLYLADGLHPGPAGQRLILERVLRALL